MVCRTGRPSIDCRSTALHQLASIQSQELLRAEEFGRFISPTGGPVQILQGA
jgi:hypothetical protein